MPISNLCSKQVVCIEKTATLQEAARLMKDHHVGAVVVIEQDGKNKPIGMITDRDIVISVVAENQMLNKKVQDVMSTDIVKVIETKGIAEVVDQMENHGVRRMIVIDEFGDACGVVTADDILQLVARELNGLGKMVQRELENEKNLKSSSTHMTM